MKIDNEDFFLSTEKTLLILWKRANKMGG